MPNFLTRPGHKILQARPWGEHIQIKHTPYHVGRLPNSLIYVDGIGEDDNEDKMDEVKDRKVESDGSRLKNSFRHLTTNI